MSEVREIWRVVLKQFFDTLLFHYSQRYLVEILNLLSQSFEVLHYGSMISVYRPFTRDILDGRQMDVQRRQVVSF